MKPPAGCSDARDPVAMPAEEAARRIADLIHPVSATEMVAIRSAMGRTLAAAVISRINVPSHVNAAVDGYALAGAELPSEGTRELRVVGTAWAGQPFDGEAGAGQCVRIMTGAKMPQGTDTALMQEQVEVKGELVRIGAGHRTGENVRQPGEDLAIGEVAIAAGKRIGPAELGLLASLGHAEVRVTRRLRVAFFSTGDELRSIGQPLAEGEIYDSNRYTLYGMLTRLGVELVDMGVINDRREALRAAFGEASRMADVVITTGGVSVGEADFVREVLAELGRVDFWKLAIKPGRPLAFGRMGEAVFFGLPGNPVAVMVTFYQFVRPALRRMMGQIDVRPHRFHAMCLSPIRKKPGRTEFLRGILERAADGHVKVSLAGRQGSGILSSMSHADCFIVLPPETGDVAEGNVVEVEPFEGLV